jgi:hypothetical protein
MKFIYLFVFGIIFSINSSATNSIQYQKYGLLGDYSLSYVYTNEYHSFGIGIGHVKQSNKNDSMQIYNSFYSYSCFSPLAFSVASFGFKLKPCNIGASLIYSDSSQLFGNLPDHYPSDYYYSTAIRSMLNYQISLDINHHINIYLDFNVIDIALISYIRNNEFFRDNYNYLGMEGVTNYGFGARWVF